MSTPAAAPQAPPAQPTPQPATEQTQAQKDALAGQMGLASMLGLGEMGIVEQRIAEPEGGMKVVKTEAAPAGEEKPAEKPAAAPAAEQAQEDIYDKALAALSASDQPVPQLNDEAKNYLKAKGIEDIDALLSERASERELISQYKGKAEAHDQMLQSLSTLPAEIGEAIEAHNKGEDYTKALMPLTKGVSISKEAKRIDKYALVEHYFPGKFNEEQIQAIKYGDETLEGAFNLYREQAIERHEARRKGYAESDKARAEEEKAKADRHAKATADAIAYVRQDKVRATFLDKKTIDDFTSGKLIDELLYNKDGTPKLESLAHLIDSIHLPKMMERMKLGTQVKGRNEGQAKVLGTMSSAPDGSTLQRQGAPAPKENADALHKAVVDGQNAVAAMFNS